MNRKKNFSGFKIVAMIAAIALAAFILITLLKLMVAVLILGLAVKFAGSRFKRKSFTKGNMQPLALAQQNYNQAMPLQTTKSWSGIIPIS